MNTSLKLGGFVVALAAVLAIAFGIGAAVGPAAGQDNQNRNESGGHDMTAGSGKSGSGDAESGHDESDHAESGQPQSDQTGSGGHAEHGGAAADQPAGLMISQHGYTLDLGSPILEPGRTTVTFRVLGPDGQPVTDYQPTHDKDLHFIAVRRDMAGYQHVHPTLDDSGAWTTEVELTAGVWRFFADFRPAEHDETMTLGGDVSVAGDYQPRPLPPVSRTAEVDDYSVTLTGKLTPGESSELTLTVRRNGKPVTDLQPYLAAYGHLVALRSGDLAYLHVHPEGEPGDGKTEPGPGITFFATAPTAGPYRLYLDFKHDGVVRTAEFTVHAGGSAHGHGSGTSSEPSTKTPQSPTSDESAAHESEGHESGGHGHG